MVISEAPIFDGRPNPWTFINWLDEMDQFFDQICLPDANKVRFARLKLRSRARDFWRSIENNLKGRSKLAITDWNEIKQILREKYVPQCYQENYQHQSSPGTFLHHRDSIQQGNTSSFHQELTAIAQDLRKIMVLLDSSTQKKDAQVPPKTNVEIEIQVLIDDVSTFMQQEEPIIESTQEEKFQQVSEDLEGALDVEVDFDESGIEPFMIHKVEKHLQVVEVQKVDTMIQDKIVPVQHIDFVFPKEFYGVMELKVILLSVLRRVISDLKEVLSTKS
ncbi:uncharacterized protein LOC115974830 [Quercus lobata]|uniref:uncharacterized protein LOC115974830 n=1 Tax=Quercus lobata TaxID=97700 RepID=UPI00124453DA|nr:uncharacterized protein LOC115974830 [Quercus lobata]